MSQKVDIVLSTTSIQAVPGETYELGVTVTNNTQEVERFELSISDLDPSWYQFDWADMLLYPTAPGNEGTSYVRITIPSNVRPGTYAAAVEVTGTQSGVLQQPFLLTVNQTEGAEPELSLNPAAQKTRERSSHFQIRLKNPLNQPLTLQLTARSARPDAQIRIYPPLIELASFSEATATLELQPLRRNWYKSDQLYEFSVGAEGLSKEVSGSLLQTCALPWLRQLLTTPALLVAALLAPLLMTGLLMVLLWPRTTTVQTTFQPADCVTSSHTLATTLMERGTNTDIIVSQLDGSQARRVGGDSTDRLPGMFASLLSLSPDESSLVYVTADNEQMNNATLYLINLRSSNSQPVATIANGFWPSHPVWSQDSSQLAYVMRNNEQLELWKINLNSADKKPVRISAPFQLEANLFYNDPGETGPVCWSSDSSRLIIRPVSASRQTEINVSDGKATPDVIKPNTLSLRQASPVNTQLREPQLAPIGSGSCFVPTFSQNDPRWQNAVLKPQGRKLGDVGCPIATSAMLLNYYHVNQVNTDPAQLNACLDADADPPTGFDWTLPARKCSSDVVQGGNRIDFSWDTLNSTLKGGLPVIVGLIGGQTGSHYVVVVGGSDSIASTYRVNDPWDGTNYKSLGYFLEKGYHLQWLINYTSNSSNAPVCPDRTIASDKFQAGFSLVTPSDGGVYSNTVQIQYQPDNGVTVTGTLSGTTINNQTNPATGTGATTSLVSQPVVNGMSVETAGSYTLSLQNASNAASPARLVTHFVIDKTAPVVDFPKQATSFDPTPRNGFLVARRAVSLELKATDDLSGVALVQYRVNNSDWLPYNFEFGGSPVSFDKPGQYIVSYRAIDIAGNPSAEKTLQFEVDLTTVTPGTISPDVTTPAVTTVAATTVADVTTVPVPTTIAVPGLLTANPAALSFDPNTLETNLQLLNTGGGPVNWAIQPLSGPALTYLQFSQTSGIIPPGSNQPLSVSLLTANQTAGSVTANFSIVYNNNTAFLPITVLISQQPTPRVQFLSPSSGPITNRQVSIKLDVAASGVGKPNHATITAKYIDQPGGSISEHQLQGVAVPPDWTVSWDTSQLPPQTPIDLSAAICWSNDESTCVKNAATLTGLSITKPSVVITLNPNSATLGSTLGLSAEVTGGTLDHISYILTYKDITGTVAPVTQKVNNAPTYNTSFDTSKIPPQTGITLAVLACWGQDDNPANCTQPSNQIITSFTVPTPTLTIAPLSDADQKNLPLTVLLSGTVSGLSDKSQIFMAIRAATRVDTSSGTPTPVVTEATFSVPLATAGATSWSYSLDTSTWPPQSGIVFTPKVCWDGNATGNFCYPATPASLTAAIPDFVASFVLPGPPDLANPVSLPVTATPTTRVTYIKYLISYSSSLTGTVTDEPLQSLGFPSNTAPGTFTLATNFDSVIAGLKPQTGVSLKAVACSLFSNWCGPASVPLPNLGVPPSVITPITTQQTIQNTLDTLGPLTNISIAGTLTGRSAKTVGMVAQYRDETGNPASQPIGGAAFFFPQLSQPITFNVNLGFIPPQSNIVLGYNFCWNGPLDSNPNNCSIQPVYTVTIQSPTLNALYLGNSPNLYDVKDGTNLVLPVGITETIPTTSLNIPLKVSALPASNVSSVNWKVLVSSETVNVTTTQLLKPTSIQIPSAKLTAADPTVTDIKLVATPVWTSQKAVSLEYPSGAITLTVRLVRTTITLSENGFPPNRPLTSSTTKFDDRLMLKPTSNFNGNFTSNISGTTSLIKRVLLFADYFNSSIPLTTTATGANIAVNPVTGNETKQSTWNYPWDHTKVPGLGKPVPSTPIALRMILCTKSAADDDTLSSCTPVDVSGSGQPSVGGLSSTYVENLRIAGITFAKVGGLDRSFDSSTEASSSFTVTLQLSNITYNPTDPSISAVKSLRLYAYPTPSSGTAPDIGNAVLLSQYPGIVTKTVQSGIQQVDFGVYWNDINLSPDESNHLTNLITALRGNGQKVSFGIQFCMNTSPIAVYDPNIAVCSDWSGQTMQRMTDNPITDEPLIASVDRKQSVLVTWQPYNTGACSGGVGTCLPFNDYIQRMPLPGSDPTLTLNIYRLDTAFSSVDLCSNINPGTFSGIDLSYSSANVLLPGFTQPPAGRIATYPYPPNPPSSQVGEILRSNVAPDENSCTFKFSWNRTGTPPSAPPSYLSIGFPVDPIDVRSVLLTAQITIKRGANVVSAQTPTHGAQAQPYISLPANFTLDLTNNSIVTATFLTNVSANCSIPTASIIPNPSPGILTVSGGNGTTTHTITATGLNLNLNPSYAYTISCISTANTNFSNTLNLTNQKFLKISSPGGFTSPSPFTTATATFQTSDSSNCTILNVNPNPAPATLSIPGNENTTSHTITASNFNSGGDYTYIIQCNPTTGPTSVNTLLGQTFSMPIGILPPTPTTPSTVKTFTTNVNATCTLTIISVTPNPQVGAGPRSFTPADNGTNHSITASGYDAGSVITYNIACQATAKPTNSTTIGPLTFNVP